MAKKQETTIKEIETPFDYTPEQIKKYSHKTYLLADGTSPLTYTIKSRGIYVFDEEKGVNREIKYCKNQQTIYVDEMTGTQSLSHVTFLDGILNIPKEDQVLQKFMEVHPQNNVVFEEFDRVKIAKDEVHDLELEVEALMAAKNLDVDMAEAIMRVEVGSEVSRMSSKELKRDLLLYAKKNPALFLELVKDDNIQLRNFGIKATEAGILKLSPDQRTFFWKSNNRKLLNIPFDEHPYSALAAWFKTDEGMEIYSNIEKQLK